MTLLGGVLATLALLAGFRGSEPPRPHLARVPPPARGALIEAADHPEWKQFLVQAAYRRAGELDRLRELPDTPAIMMPPPVIETPAEQPRVATLPPAVVDTDLDVTGAIEEPAAMAVDIGEASSTELPVIKHDLMPPAQRPESLKPLNESRQQPRKMRRAKAGLRSRGKPAAKPAPEPDLLTRIFGPASAPK